MRITHIRAVPLIRPLKTPFIGGTYRITSRNTLITEVYCDNGMVGRAFAGDEERYQADIASLIDKTFSPLLEGEDPRQIERLWEMMFRCDPGLENRGIHTLDLANKSILMQAISAVDIALWDLLGKLYGASVAQLLGGYQPRIPIITIGGYYGVRGIPELVEELQSYQAQGLAGIKMKVGKVEVAEDIERVRAARAAVGPNFIIACDSNQAWTPAQAVEFCQGVEPFNIRWIEEPVVWYEQLAGLAYVRQRTRIPVVAGQGEISRFGCRDLVANGCVDILNVDCSIAGGITEWRRIAGMASMFNVRMAHHEEPQIAIHLLSAVPHGLYVEIFANPERDPMWLELVTNRPPIENGTVAVPTGPGLGLELADAVIERYSGQGLSV